MPEVMETDGTKAGRLHEAPERLRDNLRMQVLTVLANEHPAAIPVGVARQCSFGVLRDAVCEERSDGPRADVHHRHPALGLGRTLDDMVANLDELPADRDRAALEVDVVPVEPAQFSTPQPGEGPDDVQAWWSGEPRVAHTPDADGWAQVGDVLARLVGVEAITREQIRELLDIVTPTPDPKLTFHQKEDAVHNARFSGRQTILEALTRAHPDAGYVASTYAGGGDLAQIRGEHFDEAKTHAQKAAEDYDVAIEAVAERDAAEKDAQTPAGKFARIRDALKAGRRQTDRGELATPESYAQAKAAAEAAKEAAELRAEGEKEARAAAKRTAKAKADAVAAAKADLPTLPREELDAAVAEALAAVERIREIQGAYAARVREIAREFVNVGYDNTATFTPDEDRPVHRDGSCVWIDGTLYAAADLKPWFADIKNSIHEIR